MRERPLQLDLTRAALGRMLPMYLLLSGQGRVVSTGPTVARLFPGLRLTGRHWRSLFDLRTPEHLSRRADLARLAGQKLRLVPQVGPATELRLRGLAIPDGADRLLLQLSFGIDSLAAVSQLHLTQADFAPSDTTLELLYLAEANAAVVGELRALSGRLYGARLQAEEEATTDPLTGLRNRRAGDSVLARLCRDGAAFALVHMDLDHFKQVNDTLGHAAGDHVLLQVSDALRTQVRGVDCLVRVGGDEFVIIMPGLTDPTRLADLAARIIARLERPILFRGQPCRISASIGHVLVAPGAFPAPEDVMARADAALYAAKEAGRGRAVAALPFPDPPVEAIAAAPRLALG